MDAYPLLFASTLSAGTVLALAALGLLINEKAGIVNLGAEGMMLCAAVAGFATEHGVGLVVILVVTRNATRPVEAVAEAARQVADGQLDVVVPVDRADEIGQLAVAFNRMTAALRERQELLARLAAAEKRAEIGHLAAGLAHEIKNPLNALSLGLDVLRRRHRPAEEAAAAFNTLSHRSPIKTKLPGQNRSTHTPGASATSERAGRRTRPRPRCFSRQAM